MNTSDTKWPLASLPFFLVRLSRTKAINSDYRNWQQYQQSNNAEYKQATQTFKNNKSGKREKTATYYWEELGPDRLWGCSTTGGYVSQVGIEGKPGCCARSVSTAKHNFKEQKGRLQEELECRGWLVIFYPKFHCELNFIERYWCGCKWYARENCQYTLDGLR